VGAAVAQESAAPATAAAPAEAAPTSSSDDSSRTRHDGAPAVKDSRDKRPISQPLAMRGKRPSRLFPGDAERIRAIVRCRYGVCAVRPCSTAVAALAPGGFRSVQQQRHLSAIAGRRGMAARLSRNHANVVHAAIVRAAVARTAALRAKPLHGTRAAHLAQARNAISRPGTAAADRDAHAYRLTGSRADAATAA
ncbi:MAG TPA: hypothetical protein VM847_15360, partial [Tahibacter sp.]|nr:hypothetical protein [Tahibacter sp.]